MEVSLQQSLIRLAQGDLAAQIEAARGLAQSPTAPTEAAAELVRKLEGPYEESLMQWIEAALEKIESPPAAQADQLTQVLNRFLQTSSAPDAAYWAAALLGRMGRSAATAVPALTGLLDRVDHPNVQFKAAWALGRIGPAAKPSVPHLARAAANSGHPRLATFAKQAMEEIDR